MSANSPARRSDVTHYSWEERGRATLKLEGNLSGPWVTELSRCWQETRFCPEHIIVDLSGVRTFDTEGKSLLREMHDAGTQLRGIGPLTSYIVEEIQHTNAHDHGVI